MVEGVEKIRSRLKSTSLVELELPPQRQIDLRRAESAQGIPCQTSLQRPSGYRCCKSIAAGIDATAVAEHAMRAAAEWSVGIEQFDDTTDRGDGYRQRVISKTQLSPWRLDRHTDTTRHVTVTSNLEGVSGAHEAP
jgi:hypothetical protein